MEYYDLCSEFMVFGWGESLHFAPLSPGESLTDSKIRHQRLMISKLALQKGMTVVDIGCGSGGPMRRVAREAGVRVVGIDASDVQLQRARSLNAEAGLNRTVNCVTSNFMDMSTFEDNAFDRGYAIESTCHAPDKTGAFVEIFRVLKPGALFWGQEMCMTDRFDPNDSRHLTVKRDLMHGIALKEIATMGEVNRALKAAGFQIVEGVDRAEAGDTPWYRPLEARHGNLGNALVRIPMGRKAIFGASKLAELLGMFPKGAAKVVRLMDRTANGLCRGRQNRNFHAVILFPGPQTRLSAGRPTGRNAKRSAKWRDGLRRPGRIPCGYG